MHAAIANALRAVVSPARSPRVLRRRDAAARASSGSEAGSSSASDAGARSESTGREQRPGFSQNKAISLLSEMQENPWSVNTYHSKRASHKVNDLGDIIGEDEAPENILEQPGWDDAGKLRFCVATVAAELDMPEADVDEKLQQLFRLAPGIERRVGEVKVADIVRMVASLPDVVAAFVRLREIFPGADLGKIVEGRPGVLLEDMDHLAARMKALREETPKLNWDAILTDFPVLFDVQDLAGSVRVVASKFPGKDVTETLGRQPTLLLSVQSGDDMISYDHGSLKQVKATIAGDRTSDGW